MREVCLAPTLHATCIKIVALMILLLMGDALATAIYCSSAWFSTQDYIGFFFFECKLMDFGEDQRWSLFNYGFHQLFWQRCTMNHVFKMTAGCSWKKCGAGVRCVNMLTFTLPAWYMLYARWELAGGWELAGDQIGKEVGGNNNQTKKAYILHLIFNLPLPLGVTKGDLFVMLISFCLNSFEFALLVLSCHLSIHKR